MICFNLSFLDEYLRGNETLVEAKVYRRFNILRITCIICNKGYPVFVAFLVLLRPKSPLSWTFLLPERMDHSVFFYCVHFLYTCVSLWVLIIGMSSMMCILTGEAVATHKLLQFYEATRFVR